jgi:hypothetical protein
MLRRFVDGEVTMNTKQVDDPTPVFSHRSVVLYAPPGSALQGIIVTS